MKSEVLVEGVVIVAGPVIDYTDPPSQWATIEVKASPVVVTNEWDEIIGVTEHVNYTFTFPAPEHPVCEGERIKLIRERN